MGVAHARRFHLAVWGLAVSLAMGLGCSEGGDHREADSDSGVAHADTARGVSGSDSSSVTDGDTAWGTDTIDRRSDSAGDSGAGDSVTGHSETESGTGAETDTDTETGGDTESGTASAPDTGSATDTGSAVDTGSDTQKPPCVPVVVDTAVDTSGDPDAVYAAARQRLEALVRTARDRGVDATPEEAALAVADAFDVFIAWDAEHPTENEEHFALVAAFKNDAAQLAAQLPEFERTQTNAVLLQSIAELGDVLACRVPRRPFRQVRWDQLEVSGSNYVQADGPVFWADYVWKPSTPALTRFFGDKSGHFVALSHVQEDGSLVSWLRRDLEADADPRAGTVFVGTNLPGWLTAAHPEVTYAARHFTAYDIDHPEARAVLGDLLTQVSGLLAGKRSAALGYMLMNELSFFTQAGVWNTGPVSSFTMDGFRQWLADRHHTIGNLNALWDRSFASFDAVQLDIPIDGALRGTPVWYDWARFNMDRVTGLFQFMKDQIRQGDPQARVHIKLMPWLWFRNARDHGIDMEALTRLSDISGCDAQAYYSRMWKGGESWEERYAFEWRQLATIYDFFRSVRPDQPIYDSENHFLSTTSSREMDLDPTYVRAAYLLGLVHGLDGANIWVWGRNEDGSISSKVGEGHAGSLTQQPRVLAAVTRAFLDANAAADLITALQQVRAPWAIYYAEASAIADPNYMDGIVALYEALYFSGIPVRFATAHTLEETADPPGVVFLWGATHLEEGERAALGRYAAWGTIVADGDSGCCDAYGRDVSPWWGTAAPVRVTGVTQAVEQGRRILEQQGEQPLFSLVYTEGADGCALRAAKVDGERYAVFLINVGKAPVRVRVQPVAAAAGGEWSDGFTGASAQDTTYLAPMEARLYTYRIGR